MENVKAALAAIYSGALQDDKKQALLFVEEFQKSAAAWEIAVQILSSTSEPLEYKMYAAQTLRSKATYDLQQLPEQLLLQLKDSMLQLLSTYNQPKDRVIRTQLCLALCQLALQHLQWTGAMAEISAKLSQNIPALLEFLKVLPEELSELNRTALTDEEFTARTNELITASVEHVLMLLKNLAEQNLHTSSVLDCLNSWIKECPIESVLTVDAFVGLIFKSLTNDPTFDKAIECLCTILRETRDIENYQLIDALYQQVLQVHGFYAGSGRLSDNDIASGLTKLYVEAGESWHVLIAKNAAHFRQLVQILVDSCKYDGDLDVVKYTFYFWYQLKQMLTLPRYEEARRELLPLYLELIHVIIGHLCYPAGDDDDLFDGDKEQEDKFKEFRYEMGDVLKDCCAVVGAQKALDVPFQKVQTAVAQRLPWQQLEAPLFSMRVMAKEVLNKEKTILPVIMQMLVQLPEHPKIRYATTLVLGRYSEWTAKNPEYLQVQLNYIIQGFEGTVQKDIANATSQALMYFCQDCASDLVGFLDQLYMLYGQVLGQLDVKATYDLVNGLSHVIQKLPIGEQYKASETFLTPTLSRISELSNGSPEDDNVATAIHDQAEIISIFLHIMRYTDLEKPDFPIATLFMDRIWPLLAQVLTKFGKLLKVSEHIIKVVKNAIQGCSIYLTPLLPQLAQLLHEGFQSTYFGCYLWVTGIIVREFGDETSSADTQEAVYQLALSQSALFFHLLNTNSTIDIRSIPDVIEDYFHMANDLLMFFPFKTIANVELINSILGAGVLALTTSEEHNPLMSCIHFFVDYVLWGSPYPPVSFFDDHPEQIQQLVKQFLVTDNHGQQMVQVVLEGLIFKYYNDPDANDLLIKILTVAPNSEESVQWLQNAVSSLPNVGRKEIEKLIGAVAVAIPNKDNRRVRVSLKDFVSWYARKNVNSRTTY